MAEHPSESLCTWLQSTSFSQMLKTIGWVIPALQTIHILAVAAVVSSVLMLDLRLLGIGRQEQTLAAAARRFLPFVWWPLSILAMSGAMLIVAEPRRTLINPVFFLKMGLLVAAMGVTLACHIPLRIDAGFWELSSRRRRIARLLAVVSLPLWIAIVFAGRWIAYFQVG